MEYPILTAKSIIDVARSHIGTPFCHQGRTPKVSLDCAGFIVVVCKELGFNVLDRDGYGRIPFGGQLEETCNSQEFAYRVPLNELQSGDILLIRFKDNPQHLAIFTGDTIIHSWEKPGMVCEHLLDMNWKSKIVGVYRLQGAVI